ncbi:DegT/DnrJ/EryC1/StrS family aminotransferase [Oceanicella actignis]|uniref:DegT/DnrJ/EryC1/StrS family aminotransferase n=1 Tax=Oceanicella actignis TaxID=1189325 RepID=UPI001252E44D|nr:DegT/DnrJ/EryC1/StrS family aminotransferase [Oceanicella actignis]TYO88779.1 dTDP-4-amino-4,6-dideoxygalactose transaminase [Oceanicella actignis]
MIPFLDVGAAHRELGPEIDAAMARVAASGWYVGGAELEAFESEFAAHAQARFCVGTGNGLDALTLTLRAMDIGPGDEVIVPSHTFIATWLAVSAAGATPVPVEPDPLTRNIDPGRIEAAVTPRSKAVIPVHLYGVPADVEAIAAVARRHGLRVIEDAAQAHGARWAGRRIGAGTDAACWSFYPGKNLGALGDGGAVTTDDAELAERIRRLGNYGSPAKYVHEERGANSRLDPVQAAVLRVKLQALDEWNDRRRRIADLYLRALSGSGLGLPHVPDPAEAVWHLFVITVPNGLRDALQQRLTQRGVQTLIHYPIAPHMQGAYRDLGHAPDAFPIARDLAQSVLSLPIGPHLPTESAERVAQEVLEALAVLGAAR